MLATWLSYDDLERLLAASLTAPVVGHTIVYGMSDNETVWWDNTPARHLGWRPQDSSEPFRAAKEAAQPKLDPNDPAVIYQAGGFVHKGPFDN
jgi:uronate dehydrogenase